jgi:putative transcriptional regulator
MPIRIKLDAVLAARNMKAKHLAEIIGVSETHLSLFRSEKVRGVRFSTLAKLCRALDCQPGELIVYDPDISEDEPTETNGDTYE